MSTPISGDPIETSRIILDRWKVGTSAVVKRSEVSYHEHLDRLMRFLVVRLDTDLLAQKLVGDTKEAEVSVHFPVSPWHHFKEKHAQSWWLGWFVRLRPVLYGVVTATEPVTFERYATYPHSTYAPPDTFGAPVIVERFT